MTVFGQHESRRVQTPDLIHCISEHIKEPVVRIEEFLILDYDYSLKCCLGKLFEPVLAFLGLIFGALFLRDIVENTVGILFPAFLVRSRRPVPKPDYLAVLIPDAVLDIKWRFVLKQPTKRTLNSLLIFRVDPPEPQVTAISCWVYP